MTSPTQSGASTPEPETAAIRTTATPDLPLAYSDLDEDDEDLWSDADDRAYAWGTVKIFVGLMAVAVAAAAWMAGVWLTRRDNAPRSAPSTPAVAAAAPSYSLAAPVPTSAPTPTVAAPPPVAEPPPTVTVTETPAVAPSAPTQRFAPPPTIGNGWTEGQLATSTCNVLWDGGTKTDAIQFVQRISGWGLDQATRWTTEALAARCPTAAT